MPFVDGKRKSLETGAVPTENLPLKSHDIKPSTRRVLERQQAGPSKSTSPPMEKKETFEEFCLKIKGVLLDPWSVTACTDDEMRIELRDSEYSIPKFVLIIDSCLHFSLHVYNWLLPDHHSIYLSRRRRINSAEIAELLLALHNGEFKICEGLRQNEYLTSIAKDPVDSHDSFGPSDVVRHIVPANIGMDTSYRVMVILRSIECNVLFEKDVSEEQVICQTCLTLQRNIQKQQTKKERKSSAPAKSKAPLAACGAEKLRATVAADRLELKDLKQKIKNLESRIEKYGVTVSEPLEKDLLTIMSGQNLESTPHMKFFWEQQMHLLQTKKMARRYHPQLIRFALSIHCKSPSAYRELRESGALILPSERVLRDYKNYFKPGAGIAKEKIEELKEKTSQYVGIQKYVAVVMDEMKLQENLVFDKTSGELIGYIDLGDPLTTFANVDENTDPIASHALAFLVRGLCTNLKHVVAYYFTGNVTSFQLMPLFWKVVAALETTVKLWVIAAVNDGASPNRKFFELHAKLGGKLPDGLVHKTINLFCMSRMIYFFADVPHLVKTARNCLYNSGSGSRSRLMWNDGKYLLFKHIADMFYHDQNFALHRLPKLTLDHVLLTSYSKMKVKLAIQVLSRTVSTCLLECDDPSVVGTAMFCQMINDFFDCCNVRSTTEHERKRNDRIKPYESADDERFVWMKDTFMKYFDSWKASIKQREGTFTPLEREKMFLSHQTYQGFKISVHSHIEAIKFLLSQGFKYVLSERFMQDVIEDYFGHQRTQRGRSDNPSAEQFGYNDLTIAVKRDIAPSVSGNTGGRYGKAKWYVVSDEPVKKRTKKK